MKVLAKTTLALALAASALVMTVGQDANAWVSGGVTAYPGAAYPSYDPYYPSYPAYPAYRPGVTIGVGPVWGGGWHRGGWPHGGWGRGGWGRGWGGRHGWR